MRRIGVEISAGERVAVIGRTGAGKSSLILALLRFVEQDENAVFVDGVDITRMARKDLRRKFSLMPQVMARDSICPHARAAYILSPG